MRNLFRIPDRPGHGCWVLTFLWVSFFYPFSYNTAQDIQGPALRTGHSGCPLQSVQNTEAIKYDKSVFHTFSLILKVLSWKSKIGLSAGGNIVYWAFYGPKVPGNCFWCLPICFLQRPLWVPSYITRSYSNSKHFNKEYSVATSIHC